MIIYRNSLDEICEEDLGTGFFNGWPNPPSVSTYYLILKNSTYVWLAIDTETNKVVGFINALSDKILTAYIPLLEVLPDYRCRGIGSELIGRMLEQLDEYYMVDLLCDENVQNLYSKIGMHKASGMMKRNYNKQSGKNFVG